MVKVELIPCVPNRPSYSCPLLQLGSAEILLHLLEEKEEITGLVTALLCFPREERPNITCERAFPQFMGDSLRVLAAKLAVASTLTFFL